MHDGEVEDQVLESHKDMTRGAVRVAEPLAHKGRVVHPLVTVVRE